LKNLFAGIAMHKRRRLTWGHLFNLLTGLVLATTVGCSGGSPPKSTAKTVDEAEINARLIQIANEYLAYPMVAIDPRWAPVDCRAPAPQREVQYSQSSDDESHGSKLYLLFAKDIASYMATGQTPAPQGQVVVKESWEAVPLADAKSTPVTVPHASGVNVAEIASSDGKFFHMGQQKELFIMYKLDAETHGTDLGWVYGVVAPGDKSVLARGRIDNCIKCHREAVPDRLFGPVRQAGPM
jgi:hypothetical protein